MNTLLPSQSATSLTLCSTAATATWVYWCNASQDAANPEPVTELQRKSARRRVQR